MTSLVDSYFDQHTEPVTIDPFPELTPREREILAMVAEGMTNPKIAKTLYIGHGTVRNHVSNMLYKLHLANRLELAIYYLERI